MMLEGMNDPELMPRPAETEAMLDARMEQWSVDYIRKNMSDEWSVELIKLVR